MFRRPRYNRFEYQPRYYSKETEKFKERYREHEENGQSPGQRIRFQRASERHSRGMFSSWHDKGGPEKGRAAIGMRPTLLRLVSFAGAASLGYLGYTGQLELKFVVPGMIALLVVYLNQSAQFR